MLTFPIIANNGDKAFTVEANKYLAATYESLSFFNQINFASCDSDIMDALKQSINDYDLDELRTLISNINDMGDFNDFVLEIKEEEGQKCYVLTIGGPHDEIMVSPNGDIQYYYTNGSNTITFDVSEDTIFQAFANEMAVYE